MLDNGSSRMYISKKLAQLLGLKNKGQLEVPVRTFNDHNIRTIKMNKVAFLIKKLDGSSLDIQGHSVDVIANNLFPRAYTFSQF